MPSLIAKKMTMKVLNSEDSRNFLKRSIISRPPKIATTIAEPKLETSFSQPQPSTIQFIKPNPVKPKLLKEKSVKSKSGKPKRAKKMSKTVILEMQLEDMTPEEKQALLISLNQTKLTQEDIQCEVEHIVAKQFILNRKFVEKCDKLKQPKWPKNERPQFLEMITKGLKTPKFKKKAKEAAEVKDTIAEEPESIEKEIDEESEEKKDFNKDVKESILADMVPKLSGIYFLKYNKTMMRFHQIQNTIEYKMPKVKASDMVMTYNERMARKNHTPVLRTKEENDKRLKNTMATRVSRLRTKIDEEQVNIQSAIYENLNIDTRRKIACLMTYINMLLALVGEGPADLMQITEDMLALEFKNEQERWENEELEDDEDDGYIDIDDDEYIK